MCWLINIRDQVFFEPLFVPFYPPTPTTTNRVLFFFPHLFFFTPPSLFVCHFSLFLPLNSSRLASASFPSLPGCSLCCFCCSVAVRVSWTEGESVCVGKPHTIPQHHTRTQTMKHVCGGGGLLPPDKDRKPRESLFFSPLTPPPPVPVVVETLNPTVLSPLLCGLCIPPMTWEPGKGCVDNKQSHACCGH